MFGKSKDNAPDDNRDSSSTQEVKRSPVAYSASPATSEGASSISSGLSIVGKIVGEGTLGIFGHVEGEVHASTVQIGDGAKVEGNIVAEELTIAGRVKGTIHANRVKLNSTAVVEGDIYHRSLAIEENAQFEGMSRRQENVIDTPSLVPAKRSQAQSNSNDVNGQNGSAPEGLNPAQAEAIDRNRRGKATSDDTAHY
jgi:cytoskeletal protein CcmA (bactofilin family)